MEAMHSFQSTCTLLVDMRPLTALVSLLCVALLGTVAHGLEVIGPQGTMTISNDNVTPDGYRRAAIVVNDQFSAPLIRGYKVRSDIRDEVCRSTKICQFAGRSFPVDG